MDASLPQDFSAMTQRGWFILFLSVRINFLKEHLVFAGYMFQAELNRNRTESAILKEAFGPPLKAFEFFSHCSEEILVFSFKNGVCYNPVICFFRK